MRPPSDAEVERAIEEWGAQALAAAVRSGEFDHRGALRWLDDEGRRP